MRLAPSCQSSQCQGVEGKDCDSGQAGEVSKGQPLSLQELPEIRACPEYLGSH